LLDGHAGKDIQNKKARHCDRHSRRVIDVNRAYEITLLAFKLQAAVETIVVHGKRAPVQGTHATTRTPEPKAGAE
jgi:LytS/YehU family sensor histidine kinase